MGNLRWPAAGRVGDLINDYSIKEKARNVDKVITHRMLKSWGACSAGYNRYCELFPEGATLKAGVDGLIADNNLSWAEWLFVRARESGDFVAETAGGFQNTGHQNTGHQNTGHQNTGHQNTGHQNTGHQNTGHWNTGHQNTGHWNTGHRNTGFFNTVTPEDILAFNKPLKRAEWDQADIPSFLYFSPTEWVPDYQMTDAEKIANPTFHVACGYLKQIPYQQAFQEAWRKASVSDRKRVLALPNFDAAVFKQISGIDVAEGETV